MPIPDIRMLFPEIQRHKKGGQGGKEYSQSIPSNTRTAVGKSLTLLAAFKAATMTDGEGTKSYANALFRCR